jgi:hypothetical protein
MSNVVESILDGNFTSLKEDVEQRIAVKLNDRIQEKKSEIIKQINESKE